MEFASGLLGDFGFLVLALIFVKFNKTDIANWVRGQRYRHLFCLYVGLMLLSVVTGSLARIT